MITTEIEQNLKEKLDSYLAKKIKSYARWSNWAGDLGFECDTYQALCRLKPELKPLPDLGLIKVYRTGTQLETPNLQLMQNAGIEIVEQARPYQWREKEISGRIDAKVKISTNGKEVIVPLEHKACSSSIFMAIKNHKEKGIPLHKSKYHWVRKYPGQLLVYELMDGSEFGVWFFYNKVSGDFFFWVLPIDYDYTEELIQRAERCNKNVKKGDIPKPKQKNICKKCDFAKTFCFPGQDYGPGFDFLSDEEKEAKLIRWYETEEPYKEHKQLDKELKEDFKGKDTVIGDFMITSKEYERKSYNVPSEIKEQYLEITKYFRTKIEKLGGK
ncbi:MAG: hypothetical protein ACOC5F_06255 [Candidatus Aminicenantaceae bacterium]